MALKKLITIVKLTRLAAIQIEKNYGIDEHIISKGLSIVLKSLKNKSKKKR